MRWIELGLVLLLAIAPSLLSGIYLLIYGPPSLQQPGLRWWGGTLHETTALLVLWYVLTRSGRNFADLGLGWSLRDIGVGILVALVARVFYIFGGSAVQFIYLSIFGAFASAPKATAFFPMRSWQAIPYHLLSPIFEELIVRAYLMTEIRALTGSVTLAVIVSWALQTAYHLYYGWVGALSIGFVFLAFSLYYAKWQRALPTIVAHEILNLYAVWRLV